MSYASVWRTRTNISTAEAAAILLSTVGALHVGAAPQHFGHSLAYGLFLLVIGLGELLWAAAFWRRPSPGLKVSGAVLAGASIVLWAITRVLPVALRPRAGRDWIHRPRVQIARSPGTDDSAYAQRREAVEAARSRLAGASWLDGRRVSRWRAYLLVGNGGGTGSAMAGPRRLGPERHPGNEWGR